MRKCKMKMQAGAKPRGRGRKRKCENSDDSNNEGSSSFKLKIRIDGHKKKKKDEVKEREEDTVCSIEEEVVSEEFVVDHLEGEHLEPDAGYFEEVVEDRDRFGDDDAGVAPAEEEEGEEEEEEDNEDDRRKSRTEWGGNGGGIDNEDDDDKDGISDDEKKWLDALESGQLNENGDVGRQTEGKSSAALTARQRALLYGEKIEDLLELSSIQPAEVSEEQMMKRKKKALRRKQLEVEKTERDKKETLDRLLKKQESRLKAGRNLPSKDLSGDRPFYKYTNNSKGILLFVPSGFDLPFQKKPTVVEPKPVELCGVEGCTEPKRYTCSRTRAPLCSLECYKKNINNNNNNIDSPSKVEAKLAEPSRHLTTVS